jgi:phage/plasmid-associated DNA primase
MVKAATEEYRMEEDSLQQFMSERVIEMPGAHFPMRDLFTEYKNWCTASGETSVVDTANKLTRALKQAPYSISIGYDSSKVNVMQNRILRS